MASRVDFKLLAWSLVVAAAYVGDARLGLAFAFDHTGVTAVWPPAGIALAAVVLGGYRMLPAVAVGAFLAHLTSPAPPEAGVGIVIGAVLEAFLGALLLRLAGFRRSLERMRDVVALVVLAAGLSTLVGATIGIASLAATGGLRSTDTQISWLIWWLGDMGGDLLVASAAFVLLGARGSRVELREAAGAIAICVLLSAIGGLVFRQKSPVAYVVFPALLVVALGYRQRGAVLGGLILSAFAVWFTSRGRGPFAGPSLDESLLHAQSYVAAASITALFVAAARSERAMAEEVIERLADSQRALRRALTERKAVADALAHQASHDPLTGLPNRNLFLDRLEHALGRASRSGARLAVLFLDIDEFKLVNDTLGHDVGDRLLLELTPRLVASVRPGDTVARFGGDEFVVLCEELANEEDAILIAERIAEACGRPLALGGHEHHLTISCGVVAVRSGDALPEAVLRDADAAMYRAKALGKGRVELFDQGMRSRLMERIEVESELRRALRFEEFRLFYQPVISLELDEIVAVEALLRWHHPERGLLEPAEFIHIAESSGLIVPIGEWVIAEACRQAAEWREARPDSRPISMSVNLSPRQVARSDVARAVARSLQRSCLDPALLELEITESTLLEDGEAAAATLRCLKALGVRVVLDDFGTGYSSLSYLKRFTIDALKIDRSFVDGVCEDAEDGAIVSAVLSMAQALDIHVTAEGVETEEQLERLRDQGCGHAQGYLFSAPVPAGEMTEMLSAPPRGVGIARLLSRAGSLITAGA